MPNTRQKNNTTDSSRVCDMLVRNWSVMRTSVLLDRPVSWIKRVAVGRASKLEAGDIPPYVTKLKKKMFVDLSHDMSEHQLMSKYHKSKPVLLRAIIREHIRVNQKFKIGSNVCVVQSDYAGRSGVVLEIVTMPGFIKLPYLRILPANSNNEYDQFYTLAKFCELY